MGRATTKIDKDVLDMVRSHVKSTAQTVSGFINKTLMEKLKELRAGSVVKSDYFANMGDLCLKNKKKKK